MSENQTMKWRPIETAPKNLDVVLLFEPPNAMGQGHRTLAGVNDWPNQYHWVFQVTQNGCEPTLWMPMDELLNAAKDAANKPSIHRAQQPREGDR